MSLFFLCSIENSLLLTHSIPSHVTAAIGQVGVVMPTGTGSAGVTQFLLGVNDASYLDNRLACLGQILTDFHNAVIIY
jgi:hypothetical protein